MLVTMRIPTRQFAYVEVNLDLVQGKDKPEDIMRHYFNLEDEYRKQADVKNKAKLEEIPFETGTSIETEDVTCGIGKSRDEYLKK